MELEDDEIASDGGISRPRKQREVLRRMKKAGRRTGDLREENTVRQVKIFFLPGFLILDFHTEAVQCDEQRPS